MTTEYILGDGMEHALALLTPENRKVMRLILHTGMRVGDAVCMPQSALGSSTYWYTEAKTGKRRKVQLTKQLLDSLRRTAGNGWVFPGRTHGHRSRQAVWRDLQRAKKALRIKQTFGTHSARKAFAVDLMRRYGDLGKVQKALNHDNPTVTLLYAMADVIAEKKRG